MVKAFQNQQNTKNIVFHIEDEIWKHTLKSMFYNKEWTVNVAISTNQDGINFQPYVIKYLSKIISKFFTSTL